MTSAFRMLPVVDVEGVPHFFDERLRELRDCERPWANIRLNDFELEHYKNLTGCGNVEITKEDFEAYEKVRASGVTNMFDLRNVTALSGLSREKVTAIMQNYGKLMEQYPGVAE